MKRPIPDRKERRRKRAADKRTDLFLCRCGRYLRSVGWKAVLAGPITIESGNMKFKYRLVIDFLGGPKQ